MSSIKEMATKLHGAARSCKATPMISIGTDVSVEDAYAVQREVLALRFAEGETRVGVKIGLTSEAKMKQVGVHEVIWGELTDAMRVEDGGAISHAKFVHPRAEPEVAFILGKDLPPDVSPEEAMQAVEAVAPAIEIIDSRYENFKFALPDVIADNASSSAFVIGPRLPADHPIADEAMVLEVDGSAAQTGSSAAILGHPARSLAEAARLCHRGGVPLKAGMIVLAGGATAAAHLSPGQRIRLSTATMGSVGFSVKE